MRYEIRLEIGYEYDGPSDRSRALVHLLPSDIAGAQTISQRLLDVDPMPSRRRDGIDFFGNATSALEFHRPIDSITFQLQAQAERLPQASNFDISPPLPMLASELARQRSLDPTSPHHFLAASPRVSPDPDIATFAWSQVQDGMTALQIVERVGQALNTEMRFDAQATDVDTPPAVAFANRHGVCQDFTHIMIAGLRAIGVPAGYVSGFLRTEPPPAQPRLEGADAMHAWVRAWCGIETGWVEYDPTNACLVSLDHVVIAYGRDYGDVSPVKGVLRTSGGQTSHQRVDVLPL